MGKSKTKIYENSRVDGDYMSDIIWKNLKSILFIVIIMAIISAFLMHKYFLGALTIIFSTLLLVFAFILRKNEGLVGYIYTIYVIIVGPLNFLLAILSPKNLWVNHLNKFYNIWLFEDNDIVMRYSLFLLLFYLVSMTVIFVFSNKYKQLSISIKLPGIIKIYNPFLMAILVSIVEYYIRITFKLNVPGYNPTISFAGVIVYLFQVLNYYFLFLIIALNVSQFKRITLKNILYCCAGLVVTQLPSILIGQRGAIMYALVTMIMYIMIIQFNTTSLIDLKKIRKRTILVIFISSIIALVGLGLTNLIRTGEFTTISFIIKRITGLYDGSIVLYYFSSYETSPPMTIFDFVKTLLTGKGIIPNKYYTNYIQGYPMTAVHANAAPLFITSWFYDGILGIILISIYLALIMSILEKKLKKNIIEYKKTTKTRYSAGIYCALHAMIIALGSNIIDGNITAWKMYTVPIVCYYLIRITKMKQ